MKKRGVLLFSTLAVVLMLSLASGNAFAQAQVDPEAPVGDASVYFVTYFSNNVAGAPAATVRVINDGDTGANMYADYYVFDDSQELQECCSCVVSPDGIDSESVPGNLLANILTGKPVSRGVIKVIGSDISGAGLVDPTPGLHGTATHIQPTAAAGTYAITEAPLADANLGVPEQALLQNLCSFAVILGSGTGVCSCTPEDSDF